MLSRAVDYSELDPSLDAQIHPFSDLPVTYWGYDAMTEASNSHDFDGRDAQGNENWTQITGNGVDAAYNQ